jgi:hypothetical protein
VSLKIELHSESIEALLGDFSLDLLYLSMMEQELSLSMWAVILAITMTILWDVNLV